MAIKTKFPICIEIDDNNFNIVVSDYLSKEQKEQLESVKEKYDENFHKQSNLQEMLEQKSEEFAINKHILECGDIVEKVGVMFEQKKLNKEIFQLKKEIEQLQSTSKTLNEALEEIYAARYEIMVSGDDKSKLKKEIEQLNISYSRLFEEFGEKMKEALKKK